MKYIFFDREEEKSGKDEQDEEDKLSITILLLR